MANATLLYERYGVTRGLDFRRATLMHHITGLSDSHDHSETFGALGFQEGSQYPLGELPGAICNSIDIVERINESEALTISRFSTIRWGFQTKVIAQFDIDLRAVRAPRYTRFEAPSNGPTGSGNLIGWNVIQDGVHRNRGMVRKRQYSNYTGLLSDAMANYISEQVGKGYRIGGVPYLFAGANITTSSAGISAIIYSFLTTAPLRSLSLPLSMPIPALGPLDEYIEPAQLNNPSQMAIGVLLAEDNYEEGEALP